MSLAQLSRLLPLPDSELQQVLDYAATLSKDEAVEHFTNLLGDAPPVVDFISTFNARRMAPSPPTSTGADTGTSAAAAAAAASSSRGDGVPKPHRAPKKKKPPLHALAPREVTAAGPAPGSAYKKKDYEEDYIAGRSATSTPPPRAAPSSGSTNASHQAKAAPPKSATPPPPTTTTTAAAAAATTTTTATTAAARSRPSAGTLVSELGLPRSKARSTPASRSATPGPGPRAAGGQGAGTATKVTIAGGTPMRGASTALADLDEAIRALEISTNPSLAGRDAAARRCDCVATRHPLQTAAPNCLSCGKVVCVREGLGPCTFCGAPLLSAAEVQGMIRELRAERGREKMAADREAHRRPGQAAAAAASLMPSTVAAAGSRAAQFYPPLPAAAAAAAAAATADEERQLREAEARAREHRDRLLGFQAQNARRTTVRDEAADFDVGAAAGGGGGSPWATPEERARALKRQQKLLREMEWNARPEYEKRRQVVSIDLVGGKVVKKMAAVERPASPDAEEDGEEAETKKKENGGAGPREGVLGEADGNRGAGGAFRRNPLLGAVVRPVYDASKGKGAEREGRRDGKSRWRRVQDDLDDNEAVILDGGLYGGATENRTPGDGGDEPGRG